MFAAGPKFMEGSFGNPYWMIITLGASAYEAPETPVGSSVASRARALIAGIVAISPLVFPAATSAGISRSRAGRFKLQRWAALTPTALHQHISLRMDRPDRGVMICSLGESLGRATRQAWTQPVSNTLVDVRCTMQDE
jgi:hypothetical protein